MTNDEIRMNVEKPEGLMTNNLSAFSDYKSDATKDLDHAWNLETSGFEFRTSFGFRHSGFRISFVIRHWSFVIPPSCL